MPNSKNIMEFCCYHNPDLVGIYNLYPSDCFTPHYGPSNELNFFINEFSMFIDVKNKIDTIEEDYIACSHYRRRILDNLRENIELDKFDEDILYWREPECMQGWIKGYVPWMCSFCDIDIMKYYNEYAKNTDESMVYDCDKIEELYDNINYLYMRETFIMHKKHFLKMVNFIEGFLKYLFNNIYYPYNFIGFEEFMNVNVIDYCEKKIGRYCWWNIDSTDKDDIPYNRFIAYIIEGLICHYCSVKFGNKCRIIRDGYIY